MKIFTAAQIAEIDQYTIEHEPISSTDLMERAALTVVNALENTPALLKPYRKPENKILIFCGMGNNGGDGLVIARHLASSGYQVIPYLVTFSLNPSADNEKNQVRLSQNKIDLVTLSSEKDIPEISSNDLVIDAIFGSGLSRPIEGFTRDVVKAINESEAKVLSIDIPSGLFAENNRDNDHEAIVKADVTYTFQFPKLAFFFPENYSFVGVWKVMDIGLHPEIIHQKETQYFFVTKRFVSSWLPKRPTFSHKGTFGHALLVGGAKGKMGAMVMAVKACLRAGSGLVTTHLPNCGTTIMQSAVPEAMVTENEGENYLKPTVTVGKENVIGFGPGAGTDEETGKALKVLIQNTQLPMVIDADGLNLLAENKTWLSFLPSHTILTPHPGEFERLVGNWNTDEEKLEKLKDFCHKFQVVTVLKGAYTVTCTPSGHFYFNSTGNPGMATGGSGDVLFGMITGLRAQGLDAIKAALLGVYLHGKAGDKATAKRGEVSLIATDIIDKIKI